MRAMHQADLFPQQEGIRQIVMAPGLLHPESPAIEEIQFDAGARNKVLIKVACHDAGRWMWSTGLNCRLGGGEYAIGPKWGHFASSRYEAICEACAEMRIRIRSMGDHSGLPTQEIDRWLSGMERAA